MPLFPDNCRICSYHGRNVSEILPTAPRSFSIQRTISMPLEVPINMFMNRGGIPGRTALDTSHYNMQSAYLFPLYYSVFFQNKAEYYRILRSYNSPGFITPSMYIFLRMALGTVLYICFIKVN